MKFANAVGGVVAGAVAIGLVGCGGETTEAPPAPPAPTPAPTFCELAPTPAPQMPDEGKVFCPGGEQCVPGTCCAGVNATNKKTFPCPTTNHSSLQDDSSLCEVGRAGLVDALLAAMDICEKYTFVRGTGWREYEILSGMYIGNAGGGQRFGIPSLNMHDSGNGFNNIDITERSFQEFSMPKETAQVTSFPVALNLASIWSEDYAKQFGEAMGEEFKAKGANCLLGPALEIHRVPRNGRNAEYISGESPYLGARLVKPYVRGVQSKKVLASAKHFIANHQETDRRVANSIVDARTRYEMYYPPFEAAVEADVAMQMCGYNQVNGIWNCGSKEVLKDDLKGALGFKGWVQSDWWAFHSFEQGIEGGVDQEMPGTPTADFETHYTDVNLNKLVEDKGIGAIDEKVRPQLDYMLKYGLVEPDDQTCRMGECKPLLLNTVVTTEARQNLSRDMATKAVVLLKNDQKLLPFNASITKIALLGKTCDLKMPWLNDWGINGASYYYIGGSGRNFPKGVVTIKDGLEEMCKTKGCTVVGSYTDDVDTATEELGQNLSGADVAILCGGVAASEDYDRPHLSINEEAFFLKAAEHFANIPLVTLTMTAGTIIMPWMDNVTSALTVFNPGKYAGHAFADTLFGNNNPSAKLPLFTPKTETGTTLPTYPADGQKPTREDPLDVNYTERLCVAWHCHPRENIMFPFGYGLSYTTFKYESISAATVSAAAATECDGVIDADKADTLMWCITADIRNDGDYVGTEVAQLYMGFPTGLGEPAKVHRGFHRLVDIAKGASMKAKFPIYKRDLQTYNAETKAWQDHTGSYQFWVGTNEGDEALSTTIPKSAAAATQVVV